MNAELEALGRRAVACKHWCWLPGVKMTNGSRMLGRSEIYQSGTVYVADPLDDDLPDLSDAATVGALLGLVREAWQDPYLHCQYVLAELGQPDCWIALTDCGIGSREFAAHTEAEALVCALEAAP